MYHIQVGKLQLVGCLRDQSRDLFQLFTSFINDLNGELKYIAVKFADDTKKGEKAKSKKDTEFAKR